MKVITLAAGLGKRVQKSNSYLPKALMEVAGEKLIKWSIDSFHALKSQGILKQSDFVFVVRQSDYDEYELADYLHFTFGNDIEIIRLEKLTNGPAESANLAIETLKKNGKINQNEPIIINDCDHYFTGDFLTRSVTELINAEVETIQVFETMKDPEDLSWSFVREDSREIIEIVEKPSVGDLHGIDVQKGLVGVYAFSSSKLFTELYRKCQQYSSDLKQEVFVSKLLTEALANPNIKFSRIFVDYFVSMGTHSKILNAEKVLTSPIRLKEASTIFLDLDGTIVLHDKGFFSNAGVFMSQLIPINYSELQILRELWNNGNKIVITTARPESQRENVLRGLAEIDIRFDYLVMGITGGTRYLVNDSKDTIPSIQTAIAVQVDRDKSEFSALRSAIESNRKLVVEHEYLGESGERTLLMNREGYQFVRKLSQSSNASKELISYQSKWMQQVSELYPTNLPKILDISHDRLNHQSFFDMEYLPNLEPLGQRIFNTGILNHNELIENAVTILDKIYDTYRIESDEDYSYLVDVLKDKALIGYKVALRNLKFDLNSHKFPLSVNDVGVRNILPELEKIINFPEKKFLNAIHGNSNVQTLIHGDPTLSNLVIDSNNVIFLLDPIGTRVLPNYPREKHNLGRTHPYFDYTRIQLSLFHEYERWNSDIQIDGVSQNIQVTFERNPDAAIFYSTFENTWNFDYSMKDPLLARLFYLTTLCRILPYKSKNKKKEAYYMLSLIQEVMTELDADIHE
jgi:choline kinase